MSKNKKQTSEKVAELAARTLHDHNASGTAKRLAGSVLSQTNTDKETGRELEDLASKVLQSPKYSDDTKSLAGSVLSQANKDR
jgi:endonuclease III